LSDPICALYLSGKEVGRTEFIMNTLNPHFKKAIRLSLKQDDEQPLEFKLYDVDFLSGQEVFTIYVCTHSLRELSQSQ
jgi:Ca2+-dependent lipid-binding protein